MSGVKIHPRDKAAKAGITIEFLQEHFAIVDGRLHLVKKFARKQRTGLQPGTARGRARRIKVSGVCFSVAEIAWATAYGKFQRTERANGDVHDDHIGNLMLHPSEYGSKRCPRCKLVKSGSYFSRNKRSRAGLNALCKACESEYKLVRSKKYEMERGGRITNEKRCSKCSEVKRGSEFNRYARRKDGLSPHCRECESSYQRKLADAHTAERAGFVATEKICSKCRTLRPAGSFTRENGSKDGLSGWCKSCVSESYQKRSERNARERAGFIPEEKRCNRCCTTKPCSEFSKFNGSKDGLNGWCKECASENSRSWLSTRKGRASKTAAAHRRRSLVEGAQGDHTADDVFAMIDALGAECIFCGSTGDETVDHILSLSPRKDKGGSNWPQNLSISCSSCNKSKHDAPLGLWLSRQGFTRSETLAVLDKWMGYALSLDVTEESQLNDFEPVIRGCVTSGLITVDDAMSRLADVELARADLRASESV